MAGFTRPETAARAGVAASYVDAAEVGDVDFADIGAVELKGVSGAMQLHAARSRATTQG